MWSSTHWPEVKNLNSRFHRWRKRPNFVKIVSCTSSSAIVLARYSGPCWMPVSCSSTSSNAVMSACKRQKLPIHPFLFTHLSLDISEWQTLVPIGWSYDEPGSCRRSQLPSDWCLFGGRRCTSRKGWKHFPFLRQRLAAPQNHGVHSWGWASMCVHVTLVWSNLIRMSTSRHDLYIHIHIKVLELES